MGLDSLLASMKNGVAGVAGVQASNHAGFGCNPEKLAGVAEVARIAATGEVATPATPRNPMGLQRKPASIQACTLATPATPQKSKAESEAQKVDADRTATASRWWLIHYPDRDPMEVSCTPPATHAEILERHPDAVAAEPFDPTIRPPSAPMTASDETAVRAWLALIEGTDPATIAVVMGQCQRDADARGYFIGQAAAELPKPDPFPDDRRHCRDCRHLRGEVCRIAQPGGILSASRGYRSSTINTPHRCAGFAEIQR